MDPSQLPNGQQFYQPGQPGVPPQPPQQPSPQSLPQPPAAPYYDPSLYPQYVAPQFQPTGQPQPLPSNYGMPSSAVTMPTPQVTPEPPKRSHKKLLVIILIVVVLLAGGTAAALLLHKNKKATPNKTASSTSQKNGTGFVAASKKACQLFVLSDARKILGNGTTLNAGNGSDDTTDANEMVTTCAYSSGDPTVANTTVTEGIVDVTGARTAAAAAEFKADLQNLKTQYPTGTDVSGIGDGAYYVPAMESLNVVDGNYEIIIYAGSLTNGTLTPNVALTEQIAKAVVAKL